MKIKQAFLPAGLRAARTGFLLIFFTFFSLAAPAADDITPSHVYQKTEIFRLGLQALGLIDMQQYEAVPYDQSLRHPRHVMQKVRECHMLLSKILAEKGIEPSPFPEMHSMREIRPDDVSNALAAEIESRMRKQAYKDRTVKVTLECAAGETKVTIEDEGEGFAWADYLEIDPSRALDTHGRGIAQANKISFDELVYNDKGNMVTAISRRGSGIQW